MNGTTFALAVAGGILVVIVLAVAFYQPRRLLKRVGEYLRGGLRDTYSAAAIPRELQAISPELAAIRARLLAQEAEVEESKKRRQELIAFLAHDLKTPLTSVLGYLELLRDDPRLTEEERAKYTAVAWNKAKRLEELVAEFFDINTMDLTLKANADIQLDLLLAQLTDEFYPLLSDKGLTCTPRLEPRLMVRGDGDRLARVFENILKNAVSYSDAGGVVDVTAERVGGLAKVVITNTGLEIPENELSNIFERFYRLDTARSTHTGGAGLGLAIAKEIVELHGGKISAECNGNRTSFVVTLPLLIDNGE